MVKAKASASLVNLELAMKIYPSGRILGFETLHWSSPITSFPSVVASKSGVTATLPRFSSGIFKETH